MISKKQELQNENKKYIKVGFAYLKLKPSQQLQKTLKKSKWDMTSEEQLSIQDWLWIFRNVSQSLAKQIRLNIYKNLENDNIAIKGQILIRQIQQINFRDLITLRLTNMKLQSIQILGVCDMPKLQKLFLDNNNISRISCLKKINSLQLQFINFENNPINQLQLSAIKFQNHPEKIILENEESREDIHYRTTNKNDKIICEDVFKILKIQSQKLGRLQIDRNHRINWKKTQNMIKQRFINIQISLTRDQQRILQIQQRIQEQQQRIRLLQQRLPQSQQRLLQLEQRLRQRQQRLRQSQQERPQIQQRKRKIQFEREYIQYGRQEIQHKRQQIQHRRRQIQDRRQQIQHRRLQIQHRRQYIQHRRRQIQHRRRQIQYRRQIQHRRQYIQYRRQQCQIF